MSIKNILTIALTGFAFIALGQNPNQNYNKFKQLNEELPTPNVYRTAGGAPGHAYYQNLAHYKMDITLDEAKSTIHGKETITYDNVSPDDLEYLWVQLDQNVRAIDSDSKAIQSFYIPDSLDNSQKERFLGFVQRQQESTFDGGFKIMSVTGMDGKPLKHTINKTMMRVDMPNTLKSGGSYSFNITWWYNVNDRMKIGGRSGYENFEDEDNKLYTIAQFFPRMAVYNDVEGWQNKQFLGRGEFALPFGDYDVKLTVPSDHVVGATGTIQNPDDVLSAEVQKRLKQAETAKEPMMIIDQAAAEANEKTKATGTKTWHFKAKNVRDFAFASSRKFIWDAQGVEMSDGRTVMAMSLYPKEGNPLWEKYSTHAVVQTLKTFSERTFDYPYPVAYSVSAARIGMEYPMICFNFGRTDEEGNYSDRTRNGMIGVIIHEIGHNYFPMIVNSDERQWTWMDEGMTSFLQYETEQEFAKKPFAMDDYNGTFPSRRGPAKNIINYMKGDKSNISPIMTNSESIFQFGNNAYGKPATALNVLRTAIMGPELFDHAFKTYSQRWMFKHPTPADFFRTMEDASGMDLDWFWRGWFYTTDHVDINMEEFEKVNVSAEASDGKKVYQMKLKNEGGLPMPIHIEFEYTDGSKERRTLPAEIWRFGDETSKVFMLDKDVKTVRLDPDELTADTETSNNVWPAEDTGKSKFDQKKVDN